MHLAERGLGRGDGGKLLVDGSSAVDLAREFGTPLHVVAERTLRDRARGMKASFSERYPSTEFFYTLKCNSVAAVAGAVFEEGLGAAVMSTFEWRLARRLGVPADRILVNGPNKSTRLLDACLREGPRSIVIDSLEELDSLGSLADALRVEVPVLLRVNVDHVPRGMNTSSAAASRKASVFGLDLKSGEVARAFDLVSRSKRLRYLGIHTHLGTGIRRPRDYSRGFRKLSRVFREARSAGLTTRVFDYGGGFGLPGSREFTTREFLAYQAWGRLPRIRWRNLEFAPAVCAPLEEFFRREALPPPALYLEPGRAIAGAAQTLLLTVGAVKHRPGVGTWVITDGGAGTCAFPLYYELHEVLFANNLDARPDESVAIVGPACFSSNWVYRKKRMPRLARGDVLAVLDTGAYFLALEAGFGFPRTAVVMVDGDQRRLVRRRETCDEMASRDLFPEESHVAHETGIEV